MHALYILSADDSGDFGVSKEGFCQGFDAKLIIAAGAYATPIINNVQTRCIVNKDEAQKSPLFW